MTIHTNGNNPYLNNPDAKEVARSREVIAGMPYNKISYELNISPMTRLLKVIQALALTIFTCFMALALERVRTLWSEGINGFANVATLAPIDLFQETPEDIKNLIWPKLDAKDLQVMRLVSKANQTNIDTLTIKELNAGNRTLESYGITSIEGLFGFLGNSCQEITRLDLQGIAATFQDIQKITESCPNLNHLTIKDSFINSEEAVILTQIPALTTLDLINCRQIKDFSFLQKCDKLTHLSLEGCFQINDFSFLENLPHLTSLNLDGCTQLRNIDFLEHYTNLRSLNLSRALHIEDFSPLKTTKDLTRLTLKACRNIDFSFTKEYTKLTFLSLEECHFDDLNFLQHCQSLRNLNLSNCNPQDINFLQYCKELTSLNLEAAFELEDFGPLHHCKNLTDLNLLGAERIKDISFMQHFKELTSLNLAGCALINDLSPLLNCLKLEKLDLSAFNQNIDVMIQPFLDRGVAVRGEIAFDQVVVE